MSSNPSEIKSKRFKAYIKNTDTLTGDSNYTVFGWEGAAVGWFRNLATAQACQEYLNSQYEGEVFEPFFNGKHWEGPCLDGVVDEVNDKYDCLGDPLEAWDVKESAASIEVMIPSGFDQNDNDQVSLSDSAALEFAKRLKDTASRVEEMVEAGKALRHEEADYAGKGFWW